MEILYKANRTNRQVAENLSKAREHFRFTKAYAIKTAEKQLGATAKEIAAAKAIASGKVDDGV